MPSEPIIPGTEWTEDRGECAFCGGIEEGYAKKDERGKWQSACWTCVKPKNPTPPKIRKKIYIPPEDPIEEKLDDQHIDSTVHTGRTKMATGKPASVRRRKVGSDG